MTQQNKQTLANNDSRMALPSLGNIEEYTRYTSSIDILTFEQEQSLAKSSYFHGNKAATEGLVIAHLKFVVFIARKYDGYGLPLADLIQEGNIGLIKASKRFDPEVGVRFISYAVHWIKAQIHEYVMNNWRIVRVATTKAQRKLFFNLRKNKQRLGWLNSKEVEEISSTLGVKQSDIIEMENRLGNYDEAFDTTDTPESEENDAFSPNLYLEDDNSNFSYTIEGENWHNKQKSSLGNAMNDLDERSKDIISHRWLSEQKTKLIDLAKKYKISAERVRQLEAKAINQLKLTLA